LHIEDVMLAPGMGAFFYDDQAAIRAGAVEDGFIYPARPATTGFRQVRQPAAALGIGLRLSGGQVVWGDAMSVQYSGAAGRDPLFSVDEAAAVMRGHLADRLHGCPVTDFRAACAAVLAPPIEGRPVSRALAYGISQALLRAVAAACGVTMAEVVCDEFALPLTARSVPIFAQSGDARELNVDKMILKSVEILPHGLINSREKFGPRGDAFRNYARWVAARTRQVGTPDYRPTLHFDLYGAVGHEFGLDVDAIADFICSVADDVGGLPLNIESPADFLERQAHIDGYAELVAALRRKGCDARIVADERCNTLADIQAFAEAGAGHILQIKTPDIGSLEDAILAVGVCKEHGMLAYLGGSCAETEISAQACVHVAVATQAEMMLAKPGMGVDEALTIVGNEQSRLLAILSAKPPTRAAPPPMPAAVTAAGTREQ
jgi:methylaspartate ammonia-lyase